jgi:hypothetical protein
MPPSCTQEGRHSSTLLLRLLLLLLLPLLLLLVLLLVLILPLLRRLRLHLLNWTATALLLGGCGWDSPWPARCTTPPAAGALHRTPGGLLASG